MIIFVTICLCVRQINEGISINQLNSVPYYRLYNEEQLRFR